MKISIAMATYKGANYLEEQLTSILSQTLLPDEIIITDDDSPDETQSIIRKLAITSTVPIKLHVNPVRLGPVANFAKAISLCNGDAIALADQDDVWLPRKLEITYAALTKLTQIHGNHTPLLVHTDLIITDASLTPLHNSFIQAMQLKPYPFIPRFWQLALRNNVTGCTAMMNRSLVNLASPFPAGILMHDHWLTLCASRHGILYTVPEATILYRQHANNAVGAQSRTSLLKKLKTLAAKLNQAQIARQLKH